MRILFFAVFFLAQTLCAEPSKAVAVINSKNDSKVTGLVTFTQEKNGVRVEASLEGLSPGKHGFHIHEYGDCSSKDATSAGGHFNPFQQKHGCPKSYPYHVGDMGNIKADRNGKAKLNKVFSHLKLRGPSSIIGRAVIVHAKEDDCTSQPTGNAGKRLGCGVIGWAQASK